MGRNALVVFEGAEGVGKTTQILRLLEMFGRLGIPHAHLREPGGTSLGEAIRGVLLQPFRDIAPEAEALMFMGSRAQLVHERIKPALARGEVVLLDRFFLSTYAYQIYGHGLPESYVVAANALAVQGVVPALTIVLDLPDLAGMARIRSRPALDHIESLGAEFHERVSEAFRIFSSGSWQQSHPECGPIVRVDATGSEAEVGARVAAVIGTTLHWLDLDMLQHPTSA